MRGEKNCTRKYVYVSVGVTGNKLVSDVFRGEAMRRVDDTACENTINALMCCDGQLDSISIVTLNGPVEMRFHWGTVAMAMN